jgi:uncharacterized protein YqgV (UPF0045/DUF77 family)
VLTCHQIGTPTASVSNEVAAVQRLMKASGLSYSMHSAGTTVGKIFFDFLLASCLYEILYAFELKYIYVRMILIINF